MCRVPERFCCSIVDAFASPALNTKAASIHLIGLILIHFASFLCYISEARQPSRPCASLLSPPLKVFLRKFASLFRLFCCWGTSFRNFLSQIFFFCAAEQLNKTAGGRHPEAFGAFEYICAESFQKFQQDAAGPQLCEDEHRVFFCHRPRLSWLDGTPSAPTHI